MNKRDRITSALYKLKRDNKKCWYIHVSNLINGGLRVSIELKNDLSIDVTWKNGKIKSELIQRYYNSGSIGGFGCRIEDDTKRITKTIESDYNDIQVLVIDTIKSVK